MPDLLFRATLPNGKITKPYSPEALREAMLDNRLPPKSSVTYRGERRTVESLIATLFEDDEDTDTPPPIAPKVATPATPPLARPWSIVFAMIFGKLHLFFGCLGILFAMLTESGLQFAGSIAVVSFGSFLLAFGRFAESVLIRLHQINKSIDRQG